jgi:hypothetical protein
MGKLPTAALAPLFYQFIIGQIKDNHSINILSSQNTRKYYKKMEIKEKFVQNSRQALLDRLMANSTRY